MVYRTLLRPWKRRRNAHIWNKFTSSMVQLQMIRTFGCLEGSAFIKISSTTTKKFFNIVFATYSIISVSLIAFSWARKKDDAKVRNKAYHYFPELTRNEMIRLALLVGSDYTVGLTGIGPVTALEILAAFPSEGDDLLQGLTNFCWWMKSGRVAGPGRTTLRNKLQNLEVHKGI